MTHFRLRTQLFIATLLTICALTGALLFIIRHTVSVETQRQVRDGTENSVRAFESVQQQHEEQLSRTAAMLADLPTLKAVMTTQHAPTIQDASGNFWKLAGSDLFVLAAPNREIVALDMTNPGWPREAVARDLERSYERGQDASWWYDNGRLYWVFLRPITAGSGGNLRNLGFLAIGYQVDSNIAEQLTQIAGNQIVLASGNTLIASTLSPDDEAVVQQELSQNIIGANSDGKEIALRNDRFAYSSVLLNGALPSPVRCYVLMPLGPVNSFMQRLNRTIFVLGISAIIFGALLFGLLAKTITGPLENLVAGVRALAAGNYTYSITPEGTSEVAELSSAFSKMRGELLASQQQQIEIERVAALGRAAGSISHDLRHYLAAVVANAEFLYEADQLKLDKNEIYQEIKTASMQMTDLIDSMRELTYQRSPISRQPTALDRVIHKAIEAVKMRPEFRACNITAVVPDDLQGAFDPQKLERVFFNLLLNACEATDNRDAKIAVKSCANGDSFEIRIIDRGQGVPDAIRDTAFDPFVSFGKANGTGLGLAIVSKIVSDHGGSVSIESTSDAGTTMLVKLPRYQHVAEIPKTSTLAPS